MSSLWALYALWDEPKEWQLNVYRVLLILNILVGLGILWFSPFYAVMGIFISGWLLWWTFNRETLDYNVVWWINFWALIASLIGAFVFGLATIPFMTLYKLYQSNKLGSLNTIANKIGNVFTSRKENLKTNHYISKKNKPNNAKNNNNINLNVNNNPNEFNINKPLNNKPNFNVKKFN